MVPRTSTNQHPLAPRHDKVAVVLLDGNGVPTCALGIAMSTSQAEWLVAVHAAYARALHDSRHRARDAVTWRPDLDLTALCPPHIGPPFRRRGAYVPVPPFTECGGPPDVPAFWIDEWRTTRSPRALLRGLRFELRRWYILLRRRPRSRETATTFAYADEMNPLPRSARRNPKPNRRHTERRPRNREPATPPSMHSPHPDRETRP